MPRLSSLVLCATTMTGCALLRPMVFEPQPPAAVAIPDEAKLVETKTPDGISILALYFAVPPPAPVVVHFHDSTEQINDVIELGKRYRAAGLGFYAVEYPGYGMAMGRPSEASVYTEADAAIRYLRETLGVDNTSIVLEGVTLGAGVATEMARRGYGSRVVLIAPFISEDALIGVAAGANHFDVVSKAPGVAQPVLIIHGDSDTKVPLAMSQQLAAAFPHATLRTVPGAEHDGILDPPSVFDDILRFANPPKLSGR